MAPASGEGDEQVEVLASPLNSTSSQRKIGADHSHDLLHAIELGGGEHRSRYQVGVERKKRW
jgi:hypothetical protein